MPKVFIVGGNIQYRNMFLERGWTLVDRPSEADLFQFCGGADVDPTLYGHTQHPTTSTSKVCDNIDMAHYELAERLGIPRAGICRGGQFLNVMSGGLMVQDCNGHATYGGHRAVDLRDGSELLVSSTHHQMMHPSDDGVVLCIAHMATRKEAHINGSVVDVTDTHGDDVEAVYYEHTKSLCFQPHPEFGGYDKCRDLYFSLIKDCLGLV